VPKKKGSGSGNAPVELLLGEIQPIVNPTSFKITRPSDTILYYLELMFLIS
jgi:hypothetical protein